MFYRRCFVQCLQPSGKYALVSVQYLLVAHGLYLPQTTWHSVFEAVTAAVSTLATVEPIIPLPNLPGVSINSIRLNLIQALELQANQPHETIIRTSGERVGTHV